MCNLLVMLQVSLIKCEFPWCVCSFKLIQLHHFLIHPFSKEYYIGIKEKQNRKSSCIARQCVRKTVYIWRIDDFIEEKMR